MTPSTDWLVFNNKVHEGRENPSAGALLASGLGVAVTVGGCLYAWYLYRRSSVSAVIKSWLLEKYKSSFEITSLTFSDGGWVAEVLESVYRQVGGTVFVSPEGYITADVH